MPQLTSTAGHLRAAQALAQEWADSAYYRPSWRTHAEYRRGGALAVAAAVIGVSTQELEGAFCQLPRPPYLVARRAAWVDMAAQNILLTVACPV